MPNYIEIIDYLKEIKYKIENNKYCNGEDLNDNFIKTISLVWEELVDVNGQDLTNMYNVQKYLIDKVCKIHHAENSTSNEETLKQNINIREANKNLEDGKRAFNIYSFNDYGWDYYLVGDIHSDTVSIKRILEKTNFFTKVLKGEKIRLIFLGDYVDRGKAHLKLIQIILTLKYLFPQNIFLQKGNHDGGSFKDGIVKMWVRKPEKDLDEDWFLLYLFNLVNSNKTLPIDIIHNCLKFFESLSNIGFICNENNIIMITHGGIPRPRNDEEQYFSYLNSISDLTNENIVDCLDKSIVNNMMWSDPATNDEDLRKDRPRFRFLEQHFEEFRSLIGFDIFIRGHQAEKKGFHKFFNDRFITIFSSGAILMDDHNVNDETAYTSVSPKIINIDPESKLKILDLND